MLRTILLILAGLWILPRLVRLLTAGRPPRPRARDASPGSPEPPSHLQDLTRQDISDAEFEEIPPEE